MKYNFKKRTRYISPDMILCETIGNIDIYTENKPNNYLLCAISKKALKPKYYLHFETIENRNNKIEEIRKSEIEKLQYKSDIKLKRLESKKKILENIRIGQVYYTSWGYDQTNVSMFQVTGISGKRIVVRPIIKKYLNVSNVDMSANVVPLIDDFKGDEIKVSVNAYGLKIGNHTAYLYDYGYKGVYCSWGA